VSIFDQTLPLFKPPHVVYFVTCCCIHFGIFCVAGGVALLMPDILNTLDNERIMNGRDLKICEIYDKGNATENLLMKMQRKSFATSEVSENFVFFLKRKLCSYCVLLSHSFATILLTCQCT
jgi:hypothetical protein